MLKVKKLAQLTGHNASVFSIGPAEDTQFVLSAAGDGWVVRWDLASPEMGKLVAKIDTQIFIKQYLPEWNRVVIGNMNGGIHWVDLGKADALKNIAHHQKGVYALTRVGKYVFSGGGDGVLTRWDIEEMKSIESLHISTAPIRAIAFAPERNELAVGCSDHNIYLLDASTMEIKHTILKAHDNSVFCLHYHPEHEYLLSGGRDAHLKAWSLVGTPTCLSSQAAHWYTINDIAFHPKGYYFATASRDKTIRIWDESNFKLLKTIETVRDQGHINSVNRLFWSTHENSLISASDDRRLIVWSIQEG